MSVAITVVAQDPSVRARLAELCAADDCTVTPCAPDSLPAEMPRLFVIALPAMETPEEQLIERLRADEATATLPIVIVSALRMVNLQSVDYISSDLTIAIVEEPVQQDILRDTMIFLLSSQA